jgi:hypothetical protein
VGVVDILVKAQILDERQQSAVMTRLPSGAGGSVVQQIIDLGYATEGAIARAVSMDLGLPKLDLLTTTPEPAALALLDVRFCEPHVVVPVALREGNEVLWLAMADPTDQETLALVRRKTQKRIRPAVAGPGEIARALRTFYGKGEDGARRGEGRAVDELVDDAPHAAEAPFPSGSEVGDERSGVTLPPPLTFEELFAPPPPPSPASQAELSPEDLKLVDALRGSMEKGALILRSLAELCVEKGLFTSEEMRRRNRGPS